MGIRFLYINKRSKYIDGAITHFNRLPINTTNSSGLVDLIGGQSNQEQVIELLID